ncbi:predicted protein [Arabidopsis lyrata subsp. lyrata]|uniref:Predicted protein n=1 Tax=Arabidopsis lyrata subsp. lyrata TaxID=81972 RepID=D7KGZ6_ARALL|nr:predicted protein [Arabidopsis lyrata subsp. lyrata]
MFQLQTKGCVETERMGLLQLMSYLNSLLIPKGEIFLKSWSHDDRSSDCCHWERVKCSDASLGANIVHLSLNLLQIQSLNLSLLHSFPQLDTLDLSSNWCDHLFDPIHGLVFPSSLQVLNLRRNQLSSTPKGSLPLWIDRMSSLEYLYMRGNQLNGHFPRQLQNLKLKVIDISHNSFFGSLPRNVEFPILRELRLQNNEFIGSIPDALFEAELLEVIDMRNNNFSDMVLNNVAKASNLGVLLLRSNSYESHIPEKLCQLSEVGILDLSQNKFKGVIPSCFSKMSFGAKKYDSNMSFDPVEGFSQVSFSQSWSYTSAINLDDDFAYGAQRTPAIIVDFLTKRRYEAYQVHKNKTPNHQKHCTRPSRNYLTGSIPDSISKLKDLGSLDLSNNKLDGNISEEKKFNRVRALG